MTQNRELPDRNNWSENSEVGPPLIREQVEEQLMTPGVQILALSSETGKFEVTHEVGSDQRIHKVDQ